MDRTRAKHASNRFKARPEPPSEAIINRKIQAICELTATQQEQCPDKPVIFKEFARQHEVHINALTHDGMAGSLVQNVSIHAFDFKKKTSKHY